MQYFMDRYGVLSDRIAAVDTTRQQALNEAMQLWAELSELTREVNRSECGGTRRMIEADGRVFAEIMGAITACIHAARGR